MHVKLDFTHWMLEGAVTHCLIVTLSLIVTKTKLSMCYNEQYDTQEQ